MIEDMKAQLPDDALIIGRIEIIRYLTNSEGSGGNVVIACAVDGEGNTLPIVESLGMLRLTEDTVLRMVMRDTCCDCDEDDDDEDEDE